MKIRNGFVSNSSSSSFVMVGISSSESDRTKEIVEKIKEIKHKVLKDYKIYEQYHSEEFYIWGIDLVGAAMTMTIPQMQTFLVESLKKEGIETLESDFLVYEDCSYDG